MKLGEFSKKNFIDSKGSKSLPKEIIEFINAISNKDEMCRFACIATASKMKEHYEIPPKRKYKRRIDVIKKFNEVCNQYPNYTRSEQIIKTALLMDMTERAVSKHVYKE